MKRLLGEIHLIENRDDFFEWCDCAQSTIDFAAQFNTTQETWYFDSGYANWTAGEFTAIFKQVAYPPQDEHILSIKITGNRADGYQFAANRLRTS